MTDWKSQQVLSPVSNYDSEQNCQNNVSSQEIDQKHTKNKQTKKQKYLFMKTANKNNGNL